MHLTLIFPDELVGQINRAAADCGFGSAEAFIYAAIQNELERHDSDATGKVAVELLAETLQRLLEQTRRLADEQGTPASLAHSLTNLIFVFKAELEAHTFSQAVSMRSDGGRNRPR
jgi:hypothetical protein